jgi:hypothetical protein
MPQPDARTREVRRCRKIIEEESQRVLVNRRQTIAAEKSAGASMSKDYSILTLLRMLFLSYLDCSHADVPQKYAQPNPLARCSATLRS